MILFKKEIGKILQGNTIMLDVDDIGTVIVNRSVYDQMLLLSDRFEGELSYLNKIINADSDNHKAEIKYFFETAPEPINMLAPFLGLVGENIEIGCDFEKICGILHQMSSIINFNEFVKVPIEIRADVTFTKRELLRYKDSWESLEEKLILAEVDVDNIKLDTIEAVLKRVGIGVSVTVPATVASEVEEVQEEEDEEDDILADMGSLFGNLLKEEASKKEADKGAVKDVPKEVVKETPVQVNAPEEDKAAVLTDEEKEAKAIEDIITRMSGGK